MEDVLTGTSLLEQRNQEEFKMSRKVINIHPLTNLIALPVYYRTIGRWVGFNANHHDLVG